MPEPITTIGVASAVLIKIGSKALYEILRLPVRKFLRKPVLQKAISRTAEKFSDIENLSVHLGNWLKQEETKAEIAKIQGSVAHAAVANLESKYKERISSEYTRRIDEAKELLEEGKPKTAKSLYESILEDLLSEEENHPKTFFRVYTNLACCELELGEDQDAASHYEAAHSMLPGDHKGLVNLAIPRILQGKAEEGLGYVDIVLEQDPGNIHAICTKANLLERVNRQNEATALFDDKLLENAECC